MSALPASQELVATFLAAPDAGRDALARRRATSIANAALPHPAPSRACELSCAEPAASRRTRAAAPDAAMLTRLAETCRSGLASQRDRVLLLFLAAGLGRTAIVALPAEQLRFTGTGLDWTTGRRDSLERSFLPQSVSLALCPVRAVEDWLRASAARYGPVFRKVHRYGQLEHAALGADAIPLT